MQNKVMGVDDAVAKYCFSGMTVMLPGFVNVGVSETLIDAVLRTDITDLNVISNNTSIKVTSFLLPFGRLCILHSRPKRLLNA